MLSALVLFNSLKNSGYRLLLYAMTKQKSSLIIGKKSIRSASFEKTKVAPKPIRFWIDGKCFNIHPMKKRTKSYDKTDVNFLNDTCNKNDVVFITKDNGMITSSLRLPLFYCKKLKFQMMNDIENLMEETNTHISIPKIGEMDKLKILGDNKQQIKKAFQGILDLISNIRNETRPLQFLSIPLCNEEIKSNFMEFKKKVLQEKDIKGVDETVFISPLKLHLTVTVMVLIDHGEKQEAIKTLQDYHKNVLRPMLEKNGPLKIQVTGIECMNNKYEKVHVLYAKAKIIDETVTLNLQELVNGLSDYFYDRGLLKQYQENITVHMTLMNTKYREDSKINQNSRNKHRFTKRVPFDARTIMKKYKDFDFGTCDFTKIHISIMSSVDKTGFYEPLATIEA